MEPGRESVHGNRQQPSRELKDIDGDLQWEVEKIVRSEIRSYRKRVRGRYQEKRELWYFVKWQGCSEDENTWDPATGMENAEEVVENFHNENPDMPGRAEVR